MKSLWIPQIGVCFQTTFQKSQHNLTETLSMVLQFSGLLCILWELQKKLVYFTDVQSPARSHTNINKHTHTFSPSHSFSLSFIFLFVFYEWVHVNNSSANILDYTANSQVVEK